MRSLVVSTYGVSAQDGSVTAADRPDQRLECLFRGYDMSLIYGDAAGAAYLRLH